MKKLISIFCSIFLTVTLSSIAMDRQQCISCKKDSTCYKLECADGSSAVCQQDPESTGKKSCCVCIEDDNEEVEEKVTTY